MNLAKNKRLIFFLSCDIVLIALSIFLAFELRFSGEIPKSFYMGMIKAGLLLLVLKVAFLFIFRIYRVACDLGLPGDLLRARGHQPLPAP